MKEATPTGLDRWSSIGLCALAVLVLAVGLLGTSWYGSRADRRHREELLAQAVAVAQTVNPEQVKALSFSEADLENPSFQRLRGQLRTFAEALGLRSLYTMALREGRLVFGPESLAEDDPFASPPGTVYEEPGALDFEVFHRGLALTQGPETDEYGTFISALAPVLDPLSGRVLLAVGIDVEAQAWHRAVSRARRPSILLALALLSLLMAGCAVMQWRRRRPSDRPGPLRYADAALCASVGVVLTLAAALLADDAERNVRRQSFSALARSQAAAVLDGLRDLSNRIEDMAFFFAGSRHVDRNEFLTCVRGLASRYASLHWFWVPSVPARAVGTLEAQARGQGAKDFSVWRMTPEGAPERNAATAVCCPILYAESPAGRESMLGFDLRSLPPCREAIEAATLAGTAAASDPVIFPPDGGGESRVLFVFQPAAADPDPGFVAVAMDPEQLVRQTLRRSGAPEPPVSVSLFLLSPDRPPRFLGSSSDRHGGDACWQERFDEHSVTLPVFLFGRAFALLVHPGPGWRAAKPLWSGVATAVAGLLLTALLTTVVALLAGRRASLEREVLARTSSLRESEERFRLLVENSPGAIFVQTDWRFAYLNPAAVRLFGADSPERLLQRPVLERFHPDVHERVSRRIRELNEGGRPVPSMEEVYLKLDGTPFDVEVSAVPMIHEGRRGALVYFSDISARKEAEGEVRRSEARLRSLVAILQYQAPGTQAYLDFSLEEAIRLTGSSLGYIYHYQEERQRFVLNTWSRGVMNACTIADPQTVYELDRTGIWGEAVRQRRPILLNDFQAPHPLKKGYPEGHAALTRFMTIPVFRGARIVGVVGVANKQTDYTEADVLQLTLLMDAVWKVTDQRDAEQALRESEEKYRLLVENAGEAVFVAQDGMLTFFNARCLELIGYPEEDLRTRPFTDFIHPQDRELVMSRHLRRMEDPGAVPPVYAFRIVDRRGNTRRVELNSAGLVWDGRPATLNFMSDITERTALEEQFRHAQKMESVGRLAGGVAHDFNNMLAVILGYTEMSMKETDPSDPLYEKLLQIHDAARRSADLTRQLLAFARKQTVLPRVLDLNETVAGMLTMLQRLLGEDLKLVWKPGADLWPVKVDPSQVDQVLANLAVNARDAIRGVGTVTIETANVAADESYGRVHADFVPGRYVQLTVSDTGSGMDRETMEHLFEPFFTTKEKGKGTGLGLATVYGIVRQNNGFIHAYGEPGRGAAFKIYLPRAETSAGRADDAGEHEPAGGTETVLLVEDEEAVLQLGRSILQELGYTVLAAGNPSDALDLAGGHPGSIDLLVTDLVMPEMNGKELRDRVRDRRPGIKTLFMSGYSSEAIVRDASSDGEIRFVQKPFSIRTLASAVRLALDPAPPRTAAPAGKHR